VILLLVAALLGHHSLAADFDITKPVTLAGRVTKIEWLNPHVHIDLNVKDQHWSVELGSPNGLKAKGWTRQSMHVGDLVTVEGSRAKDGRNLANARSVVLATGVRMFTGPRQGETS